MSLFEGLTEGNETITSIVSKRTGEISGSLFDISQIPVVETQPTTTTWYTPEKAPSHIPLEVTPTSVKVAAAEVTTKPIADEVEDIYPSTATDTTMLSSEASSGSTAATHTQNDLNLDEIRAMVDALREAPQDPGLAGDTNK